MNSNNNNEHHINEYYSHEVDMNSITSEECSSIETNHSNQTQPVNLFLPHQRLEFTIKQSLNGNNSIPCDVMIDCKINFHTPNAVQNTLLQATNAINHINFIGNGNIENDYHLQLYSGTRCTISDGVLTLHLELVTVQHSSFKAEVLIAIYSPESKIQFSLTDQASTNEIVKLTVTEDVYYHTFQLEHSASLHLHSI